MQTKITIRNEAHTCYIDIEGTIGVSEQMQFESADNRIATYERLRREVQRITEVKADNVVVNIRSTGGDVNDALLIYDALRSLDASITTCCYGYTASAATIIAQAADPSLRLISANALYLIHRATCAIDGDSSSLDARADLLRKTDERLSELYALHSGKEPAFYQSLMSENDGQGRWLSAEEAVEAGLADAIIEDAEFSADHSEHSADQTEDDNDQTAHSADQTEGCDDQTAHSADQIAYSEGAKSDSTAMPHNASKRRGKTRRSESVAGGILRYLLSRLAYRIEEWIDRIREKRQAKRAEKAAERAEQGEELAQKPKSRRAKRSKTKELTPSQSPEPTKPNEPNEPNEPQVPAAEPISCEPQGEKSSFGAVTPQASAARAASMMSFRQRQSLFSQTTTLLTEDPAINSHTSLSNAKAYEEDARIFGERG